MAPADDYGYANVGFAHGPNPGNPEVRTPTMDGLVKEGVILDRHCAQPPLPPPPGPRALPPGASSPAANPPLSAAARCAPQTCTSTAARRGAR